MLFLCLSFWHQTAVGNQQLFFFFFFFGGGGGGGEGSKCVQIKTLSLNT